MSLSCQKYLKKYYTVSLPKKVVPRVAPLQALHGEPLVRMTVGQRIQPLWFSYIVNYTGVIFNEKTGLVTKSNGNAIKATKWLANMGVSPERIDEMARYFASRTVDLTLSTSYKDLLRCSMTRHFTTCCTAGHTMPYPEDYLSVPHVAIAVNRDKHGDFTHRWICWWMNGSIILNPVPYPDKQVREVWALTDKVKVFRTDTVFPSAQADARGTSRFDSYFAAGRLYNEMENKSHGYLKILSLPEKPNENED